MPTRQNKPDDPQRSVRRVDVERLVKSVDRVRDIGEVFTPATTVHAMLDLLPDEIWRPHPSAIFLEPASGDGNFLVAILERKLSRISGDQNADLLLAGTDRRGLEFHALEALSSVYGVDISVDNVVGGTPGHEVGARGRLIGVATDWHRRTVGVRITNRSPFLKSALWIVNRNVQVGNMLATNPDGSPSGRENLPIVDYTWKADTASVEVRRTTLGDTMAESSNRNVTAIGLFDAPAEPASVWRGLAMKLHEAEIPAPLAAVALQKNGAGQRPM